jgi:predicted esterase
MARHDAAKAGFSPSSTTVWVTVAVIATIVALVLLVVLVRIAARPLRALNLLAPFGSRRTSNGLRYGPRGPQRMDLFQPKHVTGAGSPALVVFVPDGPGDRGDFRFVGEALARQGLAVAVIDYGLGPEAAAPAALQDAAQGVASALEHAAEWGADRRRVFVMGHGAGAAVAAALALDARWLAATGHRPEELAGWIGLAGPYDFPAETSPIALARQAVAPRPAFLAAPARDARVDPERRTVAMVHTLRERGGAIAEARYDGVGRQVLLGSLAWPLTSRTTIRRDVLAFVRETPPATVTARP